MRGLLPPVARIALLTDFGLQDPYVGQMRGVLEARAPGTRVLDLSHGVPPQDIRAASFFLESSLDFFPAGTLFVCVADPGVGTSRRILWARDRRHFYLAPDNGLLSNVRILECRSVENRGLFAGKVSSTFHGRDIFAPVAAALARGVPPESLGPPARPLRLEALEARKGRGRVVFIDRFGNAVTDLQPEPGAAYFFGGLRVGRLAKNYAEGPENGPSALVGSFGTVEFALRGASFAGRFQARPGDPVSSRKA